MDIKEIVANVGTALAFLMTMIQISPIKVNPWSWLGKLLKKGMKAMGRAFNAELLREVGEVKGSQEVIREKLENHIKTDDDRHADGLRTAILRFNMELIRNIKHTHEDFSEVLRQIDEYEQYCQQHERYQNSKAVYAIANIKEVYRERLQKRDFARYEREEE